MEIEILIMIVYSLLAAAIVVAFPIALALRMGKQLAQDAHLKPVKSILIEGEVLDVIVEPELEIAET